MNQTVKMTEFHFLNKFLKYCSTLSSLIILEEVYDVAKNGRCTPVSQEIFDQYNQMVLDLKVSRPIENPIQVENKKLKERADFNEKELAEVRREMAEMRALFAKKPEVPKVEPKAEAPKKPVTRKTKTK